MKREIYRGHRTGGTIRRTKLPGITTRVNCFIIKNKHPTPEQILNDELLLFIKNNKNKSNHYKNNLKNKFKKNKINKDSDSEDFDIDFESEDFESEELIKL